MLSMRNVSASRPWRIVILVILSAIQLLTMPAAADLNPCLKRKPLSAAEIQSMANLRIQMSRIDRILEKDSSAESIAQAHVQMEQSIREALNKSPSANLQEMIIGMQMQEELKISVARTIGVDSKEYQDFQWATQSVAVGGKDFRRVSQSSEKLKNKLNAYFATQSSNFDGVSGAIQNLANAAVREDAIALVDRISKDLRATMTQGLEYDRDILTTFGQSLLVLGGAGAIGATLYLSAPVVAAASSFAGGTGMILAGCGIGSIGGGAAALLQSKYQDFALALVNSEKYGTSYSCELRQQLQNSSGGQVGQVLSGLTAGGLAGCAFVGASLVAPQATVYTVTAAVILATSYEAGAAVDNAYIAIKAAMIYRALQSMSAADEAAQQGKLELAQKYLAQAQDSAVRAGAHTLNAIITGCILWGLKPELTHAIADGRVALAALVSKSSDNTAVAVKQISDAVYAQINSLRPSHKNEQASNP